MDPTLRVYSNPTYNSWAMARKRCAGNTPKRKSGYPDRGIGFDPAWNDFDVFLQDMGPRPEGLSLDRINNDKGYSKDNCRWTTPKVQANNRRQRQKRKAVCSTPSSQFSLQPPL